MSNGWQNVLLRDITDEVTVGHVGPMATRYTPDGIPFLRSQNVKRLLLDLCDVKFIPPDFHEQLAKSQLGPGDVVIVRTGEPGACAIIPNSLPVANCSDLVIVRPGPRLDARWLMYYVNEAARDHVASHLVGAVQQHFNVGSAKTLNLNLPPLPEQRAIAGVLGALDDKIELNRRTSRTLEKLARAIFRAWFVDFEPVKAKAAGARSFPSMPQETFDALPTRLVPSELGPIPEGWEVGRLGDQCEINVLSVRKGEIKGDIEYIDISSVSVGRLDGVRTVSYVDAPSRARRRVRHGDTIWSCVRPNRRSYLFVHTPTDNRIVSTGFAVLSPARFGPSLLYQMATQPEFVDYLVANADGSAYPAVRANHFAVAEVVVPENTICRAFEKITMPCRNLIASGDRESRKLATLRDYLLPKLLSGEVRVADVEVGG